LVLLVAWALLELSDLRIVLFCDDVGDGIWLFMPKKS
jgi:hypothetical protein